MNYTEHYHHIRLDVQAVDMHPDEHTQQAIRTAIDKLLRHVASISFADIHMRHEKQDGRHKAFFSMRLGIPGPDVFAEDSGQQLEPLIRSVTDKLVRQLDKQKG